MFKKLFNNGVPIIEKGNGGYYAIYPDKKIWHSENTKNFMANPILEEFQNYKKSQSSFISLANDGEKITGIIKEIKRLSKVGFKGQEIEVIRLVLETKDGVKNFDRGTKQWVDELIEKKVEVGSEIIITRKGEKGSKDTKYEIKIKGE